MTKVLSSVLVIPTIRSQKVIIKEILEEFSFIPFHSTDFRVSPSYCISVLYQFPVLSLTCLNLSAFLHRSVIEWIMVLFVQLSSFFLHGGRSQKHIKDRPI